MTTLDLVLLAILALSALLGLLRGFVGVVLSMLAWVLAGWAAFRYGAEAAYWFSSDGPPTASELLVGYALSFIVVLLAVGAVGWGVRILLKTVGLSALDRLLGLVLGVVRGGFVACLLVLLMGFTTLPQGAAWRHSQVVPALLPGALWLSRWLPEWAARELDFGGGPGFGKGAAAGDNARQPEHDPNGGAAGVLPAPVGDGSEPALPLAR